MFVVRNSDMWSCCIHITVWVSHRRLVAYHVTVQSKLELVHVKMQSENNNIVALAVCLLNTVGTCMRHRLVHGSVIHL